MMKLMKSYNALVKILLKVGLGVILSLLVQIVYIDFTRVNSSFRILGLCNFFVGGCFLLIGGFRLFFGTSYLEEVHNEDNRVYLSLTDYMCGFGKPGEDVLAGLILIIMSLIMMSF